MEPQFIGLIAALLISGCAAGFLSGLLGIGGGAVTVPVLYFIFQFLSYPPQIAMHMAVATSASVIMVTAARSAWGHSRRGAVDMDLIWPKPRIRRLFWAWGLWIGVGAFLGALILSPRLSGETLTLCFGGVSILLALQFIFGRPEWQLAQSVPQNALTWILGLFLGAVCGLLGIGFGAIGVTLMMLFGMPVHRAIGTAGAVGVFIGVFATIGYVISGWSVPERTVFSLGYVNMLGFVILSGTGFLLAPVGVKVAHHLEQRQLRSAFGLCLLVVALKMISDVI